MKRHETTEDFKARLSAMARDKNAPQPILGAKRGAHPSVVRAGAITWNKNVRPAQKRRRK